MPEAPKVYKAVFPLSTFRRTDKQGKMQSALSRLDLANTAELLAEMAKREYVVFPKSRIIDEELSYVIPKTSIEIKRTKRANRERIIISDSLD